MKKKIRHDYTFYMILSIFISSILCFSISISYYKERSLTLIFVLLAFAIIFILLSIIIIVADLTFLRTLKRNYLYYKKDLTIIKENDLVKKSKHKKVRDDITKKCIFVIPITLGLLIIIGSFIDSVLLSMVIPGFTISIFICIYILSEIAFSFNKWDDEFYLVKKETIIVGKKYIYNQGKTYLYNMFMLRLKRKEDIFYIYFFKIKLFRFKISIDSISKVIEFLGVNCEIRN